MATKNTEENRPHALPLNGFSRMAVVRLINGMSDESWRKLVIAGKAPKAIRLTQRCTVYRNEDLYAWLKDPLGFRAE